VDLPVLEGCRKLAAYVVSEALAVNSTKQYSFCFVWSWLCRRVKARPADRNFRRPISAASLTWRAPNPGIWFASPRPQSPRLEAPDHVKFSDGHAAGIGK